MFTKNKKISSLGDHLRQRLGRGQLWHAIKAGQAGEIYKKLSKEIEELQGTRMLSWRDGVIRIKAISSLQRQEIVLKQEKIKEMMKKEGVNVSEMKIVL